MTDPARDTPSTDARSGHPAVTALTTALTVLQDAATDPYPDLDPTHLGGTSSDPQAVDAAVEELVPPDLVMGAALGLRALIMAGERYRTALAVSIGLGTTESQAIGYLYLHATRGQTDLARDLGLTSSAATALVDRLERHGVAERTRHPHDRRRLLVRLTDQGERLAVLSQQPLLETLAQIPAADLTTLTTWLEVMANELHRRSSTPPQPSNPPRRRRSRP